MTDIVERLRQGRTDGTELRWTVTDIHREAADEIERLREMLLKLRASLLLADSACHSYWEWEYGRDGYDIPNSSLLVAWRKDYEARTLPRESET